MKNRRKFSIFISSTYEDLKKERQALVRSEERRVGKEC